MAEPKTFTLTPSGKKGLFTAWSDFQLGEYVDSFVSNPNVIVLDGTWQQRVQDVPFQYTDGSGTAPIWSFHVYNALDTSSSSIFPASAGLYLGGSNTAGAGTATLYYSATFSSGGTVVGTSTAPHELCYLNIKNRCFIAGAVFTPTIISRFPSYVAATWGRPTPVAVLSYGSYVNPASGTSNDFIGVYFQTGVGAGGVTNTGTNVWSNSGAAGHTFTFPGTLWQGKTMIVNNATATPYTINAVTSTTALTTTTNGIGETDKNLRVQYGKFSWTDQPPAYAYAYYNSVTGHISNMSPVLTLTEKNMTNVNVTVLNIPVTQDNVYNRIVLFRNQIGSGGDLYPLVMTQTTGSTVTVTADGLIDNTVAAGNYFFVDTIDNNQLIALGGLPGEPVLHQPAPSDLRFIEYWNGQIWGSTIGQPFRVRYTGTTDQIPFGVPEECWPAVNFLDIPNTDGNCTGMKVIGSSLVICTNRWMYFVAGSDPSSYQLVRLSSRGTGVNHWAIDEHPGDSTVDTASAIYVSRDRRMWRHYPGGRIIDIGFPIQDKLDSANVTVTRPFIVKTFQKYKSYLVALGIMNAGGTAYDFFFYDFEKESWHDFGFPSTATSPPWSFTQALVFNGLNENVATVNTTDQKTNNIFGAPGTYKSFSAPTRLETHVLDFGDRKGLKTIERVVLYTNSDAIPGWGVEVRFDGSSGTYSQMNLLSFTSTPRYKGPNLIEFNMKGLGPVQCHGAQFRVTIGGGGAAPQGKLSKFQILYKAESTGISGDQ